MEQVNTQLKTKESEQIARQTEEFLKAGGKIEKVKHGDIADIKLNFIGKKK